MNFADLNLDKIRNAAEDAFNLAKPKTETEAKLYEILSHKNWGSSSSLMNEIARETYDYDKFGIISTVMWESMEGQRPAAWRVVFKGLTLLEHLIKNGSERCVDDARNHGHSLRALGQFNYYEGTIDRGQGVREKSKQLIEMLSDDERVRDERMKARKLREKFGASGGSATNTRATGSGSGMGGYGNDSSWESGRSGGGGYGDGGIDSGKSSTRATSKNEYSGRYDNDRDTRTAATTSTAPAPTFASLPPAEKKVKKKKKKQADLDEVPAAPTTQTDLLDFMGGAAPAPASAVADEFGALSSSSADPFAAAPASDSFGAFDSAPASAATDSFGAFDSAPASAATVDPFAVAPAPPATMAGFDAFGHQQQRVPMAHNNMMMMNSGGMMGSNANNMAQLQAGMSGMSMGGSGTKPHQQKTVVADDDDFGDFEAAAGRGVDTSKKASTSSDPLSKLISLDGLSKNDGKKKVNKLAQPVNANPAGVSNEQENSQMNQGMGMTSASAYGVMGSASAGGADTIAMMAPSVMGMSGGPQMQGTAMGVRGSMPGGGMAMPVGMGGMGMQPGMGMPVGMGGMGVQPGMGMQPGMGGIGVQPGMGGMAMQPGIGGMAMQPGMGGMAMQPGMGAMGMQGNLGMSGAMGGMGMQPGMGAMGMMGGMGMQPGMGGMGMQPGMGGMNPSMMSPGGMDGMNMQQYNMMNKNQQMGMGYGGGMQGGFGGNSTGASFQ